MALGSTQPVTEMSNSNVPGSKERPARKADNLNANCEPIVYKIWEPRRLTSLWASTAYCQVIFYYCSVSTPHLNVEATCFSSHHQIKAF
jgi:hypothetical protein